MYSNIKIVAFDADDTLWANEPFFRASEDAFCSLLEDYMPLHSVSRELLKTEIENIGILGYGVKSFIISMIETAMRISDGRLPLEMIDRMIAIGKDQLNQPVELLDGVEEVLKALQKSDYRIVMATKGDLMEQEQKLKKSGLEKYFHHAEILSEKNDGQYLKLINKLDISPDEFLMIGNSLKSDILPVLNIGGYGIHIPYHVTWELERVDVDIEHVRFKQLKSVTEVLDLLTQKL